MPPCAVKTCAVRPVFALVVGELRAPHPSKCPWALKQNASPGEQSEAPRRRQKPGQEQYPGAENQDSQHMLNQTRGSFPERGSSRRQDGSVFIEHSRKGGVFSRSPRREGGEEVLGGKGGGGLHFFFSRRSSPQVLVPEKKSLQRCTLHEIPERYQRG